MKNRPVCLAITIALLACLVFQTTAQAAKGTPDSPDFGFGAQIHLDGQYASQALQTAGQLKLDWVQIEFNWAARWPEAAHSPSLQDLDRAMQQAADENLAVLISLTNAPSWASTPRGPDPSLTTQLLVALAKRYPASLKAFELFPSANTVLGWGALPNPGAYLNLFQSVSKALRTSGLPIQVAAAGLTPLASQSMPGDVDDLAFLSGLYAAGGAEQFSILSLHFQDLTGGPLQSPTQDAHRVLRHYEEIRQVMLANHHAQGILWITRFSFPSGTIQETDRVYAQSNSQVEWLSQAFRQLRAQLYIGAAFVADFNPTPTGASPSLISANGSPHPFINTLGRLIAQNNQPFEAASGSSTLLQKLLLSLTS
jgi:hypothetical protein